MGKNKNNEPFMTVQHRQHLPRYYSIARVRKLMKEIYDIDVVKIDMGYKGYRYMPYILYQLVDNTGKVLVEKATLNSIGDYLVSQGEY